MTTKQERLNDLCLRADDIAAQLLSLICETRLEGGSSWYAQKAYEALKNYQKENSEV